MNWLVILCIYSYTAGLLLCFYAGMWIERESKQPKISARVIRPANNICSYIVTKDEKE